jgi:hypothetical protein
MKYSVFIIFAYLLLTSCKPKQDTLTYQMLSCEEGQAEAIKDANNENYQLISYGLTINIKTDGFYDFYKDYLLEKYNIILGSGGCVRTEFSKCYRNKLKELIYEKFGDKIFEIAKLEAISEFKKTKEFIKQIKPQIDNGKIYYRLHTEPRLIVNSKEVDFLKHLGFADFEKDYFNLKNYCEISFIVEKNGLITDIKLRNAESLEPIENKELMNALNKSMLWDSGVYLGEVVRSKVSFDVPLSLISNYPH